jgi:anti-repressor protein
MVCKLIVKHKIQGENTPVTASRKVAEFFEKEHKNIIRDIEKIVDDMKSRGSDLSCQMFTLSTYKNRGKDYKQ